MVYLDDSIMQKGFPATAGSKALLNFIAPFDATVVTRLQDKTERVKLAEFGLGDPGELPSPMLCNDIFGHVRSQAVQQGLCYIRPSYGTVSRYGLIPAAASMDQIGIVCNDPVEGFSLLSAIAGHDEKDGAMFDETHYSFGKTNVKPLIAEWDESFPCSGVYRQVLDILAYAEISCNISRYDGIKFGYRSGNYKNLDELYIKSRTEAFGPGAKLAAVMGCLILSRDYYEAYYEKAMKIRRLIKESLRFDEYDVILLSVDNPLAILAGLPSLSFSHNGKGMQLAAGVKHESTLLEAWEALG